MRKQILITLALLGLLGSPLLAAENFTFAVIDGEKLVSQSLAGKAASAELESFRTAKQKEIDTKQDAILKLKESLEAKAASLSEEARHEQELKYQREMSDLNILVRDAQDEFKRKEASLMQPVYKDLDTLITKYAEDHKIDLVLNRNNPGVIHASARMDVTDAILKEFDGGYKPKGK